MVLELAVSASPGDSSGLQNLRSWPTPPEAESGRGGAVFEQVPQVILEQLKLEKPLEQVSTNLFYKGPHGKYVELCGPGSHGVLPLRQSSQRQYANGCV